MTTDPTIKVRIGAAMGGNDRFEFEGWALYAYPEDNGWPNDEHPDAGVRYVSTNPDGAQDCHAHVEEHPGVYELLEGPRDLRPLVKRVAHRGDSEVAVAPGVGIEYELAEDGSFVWAWRSIDGIDLTEAEFIERLEYLARAQARA